jgi:hypothetical protein
VSGDEGQHQRGQELDQPDHAEREGAARQLVDLPAHGDRDDLAREVREDAPDEVLLERTVTEQRR